MPDFVHFYRRCLWVKVRSPESAFPSFFYAPNKFSFLRFLRYIVRVSDFCPFSASCRGLRPPFRQLCLNVLGGTQLRFSPSPLVVVFISPPALPILLTLTTPAPPDLLLLDSSLDLLSTLPSPTLPPHASNFSLPPQPL